MGTAIRKATQDVNNWGAKAIQDVTKWGTDAGTTIAGVDPRETQKQYDAILASAPKATPSVTDAALHVAAENQARALMTQRGRRSTFLGSMQLDPSAPTMGTKSLLGG
jgi:hypothetical protein